MQLPKGFESQPNGAPQKLKSAEYQPEIAIIGIGESHFSS